MRLVASLTAISCCVCASGPILAADIEQRIRDWGRPHSLMLYGGVATETDYTDAIFLPWENEFKQIGFVGLAGSTRLGTLSDVTDFVGLDLGSITDDFSIEGEVGTGIRFGDEDIPEVWSGLFLRYHDLPWNDKIYTTIAVNTGVSFLFEQSGFEKYRDDDREVTNLLHFMAPEITVADPNEKNKEFVLRFHHRSGVFGVFDNVYSGSSFFTVGFRQRF